MKLYLLITIYNFNNNQIDKLIEVLENQTNKNFIAIIHDDNSYDNCSYLVNKIKKIKNIELIRTENKIGPSLSRNKLIDYISSKYYKKNENQYFSFIDGDDLIENNYVQLFYDSVGEEDVIFFSFKSDKLKPIKISNSVKWYESIAIWQKFYRLHVVLNNNIRFLDYGNIAEDVYFSYCFYHFCSTFKSIDSQIYKYVDNPNSVTNEKDKVKHIDMNIRYVNAWIDKCNPNNKVKLFALTKVLFYLAFHNKETFKKINFVPFPKISYIKSFGIKRYIHSLCFYLMSKVFK